MSSPPQSLKAQLRSQLRSAQPLLDETLDLSALAWFALAPLWPQSVIESGFPVDGTLQSGDSAVARIKQAVEAQILRSGPGEPPWRSTWYWMEVPQRAFTLEQILLHPRGGVEFLRAELAKMHERLKDSPRLGFPPALRRFAKLAEATQHSAAGKVLDQQVQQALDTARAEEATACPEAARWIETAEPVARVLSGELVVALERAKRRLELFERISRDERALENYMPREQLRNAFVQLLSPQADNSWALHYVGDGGMGKTMLIREITGPLTREYGLVTSRIDFDQVNSEYPSRAPGLLLLALAADLKLSEDDSVAHTLISFYNELESVQRSVQASLRTGDQISGAALARLERAEGYFAYTLVNISRTRRVVLILDTCEELARIRPNGELPDSVVKTFDLLERLHRLVPSLRVVLSGRRQLAGKGFDWEGPDKRLPGRNYLRRVTVEGFDVDESERFFNGYGRGKRPVPKDLRNKVRELSRIEQPDAAGERYNPFDLNLYASWVTQSEENAAKLLSAQAHFYARERIVNRVSRLIRPLLPFIARIGEFDRALLAELVTVSGTEFDHILEEVTSQEWVDPVRGAQLNTTSGQAELETTWRVNRNIAQRLVSFFVDNKDNGNAESAEWQASSRRLRQLLPRMVLERPWHELTLDYVAVAIELLAEEPPRFIHWWDELERRIVAERAWDWGKQILAAARGRETGVAQQLPVAPLLLATELVLRTKQSLPNPDGPSLQSDWITVGQQASGDPLLADLAYRAAAGSVAARRWYKEPMRESYLQELVDMVARVTLPDRPADEPLFADPQFAATELGMIDNVIEVLECIEWRNVLPLPIRDLIHRRGNTLRGFLPKRLRIFLDLRIARIERLAGVDDVDLAMATVALSEADLERIEFADWSEPQDLRSRIALETLRLKRFTSTSDPEPPTPPVDSLLTIDADRMASAALLLETDAHFPEDPPDSLIAASIEICSRAAPTCAAHRAVPPYFQVALEARADRGRAANVLEWCDKISQSSVRELDVQLAADRVKLAVAARWRLLEVGTAQQTRLEESTRLDDAVLIAGAKAFEPPTTDYVGRWSLAVERLQARAVLSEGDLGPVETGHLKIDRYESASAPRPANRSRLRGAARESDTLDTSNLVSLLNGVRVLRPAQIALQLRVSNHVGRPFTVTPFYGRLAAMLAFEEAGLLTARKPDASAPSNAMRLLDFAITSFRRYGDSLGVLHAQVLRAMLTTRYEPHKKEQEISELHRAFNVCVRENLLPPEITAHYVKTSDFPSDPDQFDLTWRPWIARMNAAKGNLPDARYVKAGVPRDLLNLALGRFETETEPVAPPPTPQNPQSISAGERVGMGTFRTIVSLVAVFGTSILGEQLIPSFWLEAGALSFRNLTGNILFASPGKYILLAVLALLLGISSSFSSRLKNTLNFIAAVVIASGVIYLGYLGVSWLTDQVVEGVSTGSKIGLYILVLGLLASLPSVLRSLRLQVEKTVRIVAEVIERPHGRLVVRTRSSGLFQAWYVARETELPDGLVKESSTSGDPRLYSERFDLLPPAVRGPSMGNWARWLARVMGIRINCDLVVPDKWAAEPWEALLSRASSSVNGGPPRYFIRFRRVPKSAAYIWFRQLAERSRPPLPKPVRVGLSLDYSSTPALLDSWRRGLSDSTLFSVETRKSAGTRIPEAIPQGEPVNVLYVLDEVREIEGGLAIQLDPGRMLFATDLVSICRDLRLVILQLPIRPDAQRFEFDRIEAGRARMLAAQLIKAGVGAVVILPSLPEATALKCVDKIVNIIAQRPARAELPLMYAVQEIREVVASETHEMLDVVKVPLPEAVTETPFDVCLYCGGPLVLSTS